VVKDSNALDLDELLEHELKDVGLEPIMDLVVQHSWWVPTKVYKGVQVVYPQTRRRRGVGEKRGDTIDGIRLWNNEPANYAFWTALGERRDRVKNFNVCHIYEKSVWDPLHFTNLANLTAFPKSLQSLSEWPPVRKLLEYHSYKSYWYKGPSETVPARPDYYPVHWQHQSDLPQAQLEAVVMRLKTQRTTRPQFKGVAND
jgi:hypothetical protein